MIEDTPRTVTVLVAVAVAAFGTLATGTASATHTHSMQTGNGSCVLLAQNGGEEDVVLPHATGPENRRHPLHVNVHLGEPGMGGHIEIGVAGTASDPCSTGGSPVDYLND
jgi:hypothetical protein